jgi:hypothetical protein
MPLYSVETRLSSEEAPQKAVDFFGEGGLGLEADITKGNSCCAYSEGGGDITGPRPTPRKARPWST